MAETKNNTDKICGVCGDKALGYNFSAITCESCKAFFRRNALKRKEFKCPFNEECNIDVITRRFCQKCRLRKCFAIGMKKEWIMSEEQKRTKRAKIENNRIKRKGKPKSLTNNSVRTLCSSLQSPVLQTNENQDLCTSQAKPNSPHRLSPNLEGEHLKVNEGRKEISSKERNSIENVVLTKIDNSFSFFNNNRSENSNASVESNIVEEACKQLNGSCSEARPVPGLKFTNADAKPNTVTVCESTEDSLTFSDSHQIVSSLLLEKDELLLPGASGMQFSSIDSVVKSNCGTVELGELERNKLHELLVASEILKMPLSSWISDPSLLDVINMTELAIRRLIKMSKRISGFRVLCQNDQIALLKGASVELMILRSVMLYDPEKECWKGPGGPKMSIKMDVLKEAKGNVYEQHKHFINLFHPSWKNDEIVMLLLSAISLFTPDRPSTIHKDVIQMEQAIYQYLLNKYLRTVYPDAEAAVCYQKLVEIIKELRILNDDYVQVLFNVDPKDVAPLLIEIFDLKH